MKTDVLLATVILCVLCLALIPFASAYNIDIQANPDINSATKMLVSSLPMILGFLAVVIAVVGLWGASKG